ncbi:hypothetical protein RSOLAG22IIIB_12758 [Rhizoctonia solani]|uniref:Uncharacterized protein n=1 Tax=Rhizoctonia solani TaxID=456999 RepID=A0A0K6GGN6_9AGAM|nr:hypothetical protein RSOLAG22IIIB_12758 [Rhizoctonia solani]
MNQYSPDFDFTPIQTASADIDNILYELVDYVKKFKCPPELDFYTNTKDGLVLLNNEKNRPFIDQLRKFAGLWTRLARVQTYGCEELEDKHMATATAIERALFRMKEYQLRLYDECTGAH